MSHCKKVREQKRKTRRAARYFRTRGIRYGLDLSRRVLQAPPFIITREDLMAAWKTLMTP